MATFVLKDKKELTTTLNGKAKTFRFPYTTNDQEEINYLLSRGATVKKPPAFVKKPPVVPTVQNVQKVQIEPPYRPSINFEPLKGGEEK